MEEIKFEQSMYMLEDIAKELENDKLSLDDAVNKFEEAMKLSKNCKKILDEAEKKITILINGEEQDFNVNNGGQNND